MKYLCTFAEDYNTCKYLNRNNMYCTAQNTKCGFRKEILIEDPVGYERKERWYEKYYQNKR